MIPIFLHIFGDYFLQSDWQALNKNKKSLPCLAHVLLYTLPFLLVTQSWKALLFIASTHFVIDRFPFLLKRLIWLKNHLNPDFKYPPFALCAATGYYDDLTNKTAWFSNNGKEPYKVEPRKFFVSIWLYIILDNSLHLLCNWWALTRLS